MGNNVSKLLGTRTTVTDGCHMLEDVECLPTVLSLPSSREIRLFRS